MANIPQPIASRRPPISNMISMLLPQKEKESIPIILPRKDPIILAASPTQSQKAKWQNSSILKGLKAVWANTYTVTTLQILRRDVLI